MTIHLMRDACVSNHVGGIMFILKSALYSRMWKSQKTATVEEKNLIKFHQESLELMYLWNIYGGEKCMAKCDNCTPNVYHVNTNMHISVWIMTYEHSEESLGDAEWDVFLFYAKRFLLPCHLNTQTALSHLANYVMWFLGLNSRK